MTPLNCIIVFDQQWPSFEIFNNSDFWKNFENNEIFWYLYMIFVWKIEIFLLFFEPKFSIFLPKKWKKNFEIFLKIYIFRLSHLDQYYDLNIRNLDFLNDFKILKFFGKFWKIPKIFGFFWKKIEIF